MQLVGRRWLKVVSFQKPSDACSAEFALFPAQSALMYGAMPGKAL